jgi:beta-barrel assembly-enhancing protease
MLKPSRSWILALVFPVVLAGCGSGGGLGGGMSIEQEWQLGQQLAAQVAQQMRVDSDPRAVAYVNSVGQRLHARTPQANLPYAFHIVDDNEVNAFAIPGGHVYVTTGLLRQADHVSMLASVLGHEIAHITQRHAVKQMQQAETINVIGTILLGQNPGALAQIAAQIAAGGAMARFSRADEQEADHIGLQYMADAGYNPRGSLEMFQRLAALEQGQPGAVAKFFASHPGAQDRIKDISSRLSKYPDSGIVDDPRYQSDVRSRL